MFLHCQIPGFYAAVHQAIEPALRGQAVAVAVDSAAQSPIFSSSLAARQIGIWPGMRADRAQKHNPNVHICLPQPHRYKRAQHKLIHYLAHYSPQVGGKAGRFDIDLAGTERLWEQQLIPQQDLSCPRQQAKHIAQRCWQQCQLWGLPCAIGIGSTLFAARLLASCARSRSDGIFLAETPQAERQTLAKLSIRSLSQLSQVQRQVLRDCGLNQISDLLLLTENDLCTMLGPDGSELHAALRGHDRSVVPVLSEPEPCIERHCYCASGGANTRIGRHLLSDMSRDLGFHLRQQGLACRKLTLHIRWLDGRHKQQQEELALATHHDDELCQAGLHLLQQLSVRRVHHDQYTLQATGLCTAEEQNCLFKPQRHIQALRDRLRNRYGQEMITHAHPAQLMKRGHPL